MKELLEALHISGNPYINALFALAVFIVIAKAADIFVDKALRRFARFTDSDMDDKIIDVSHKPIYHTVILVGVVLTVAYLEPTERREFYIDNLVYTVITGIWMVAVIRISNIVIEDLIYRAMDTTGLNKDLVPLLENVSKIVIIAAALMAGLSIWRVDITPLMASAGIAGVAVAIAAKDTLSNFFGGLSVFMDKPFIIGDYVVLDKGERGEVVGIGLRSTRIKTRDDIMITVPNSIIASSKIINESAPVPNFRVRVPVTVAYGSDIDFVESELVALAGRNENVIEEPAPRIRFREFGESSLKLELLCWAKEPSLRGLTVHELNCAIYRRFNEVGIKFPFPQRDVHIYREAED